MKGRNKLVIILVVLLLLALAAAIFFGSGSDIETTGEGAENIQRPIGSVVESIDRDRLPQDFKKLVSDLGDVQHTLDKLNNKIETLEAENSTLKQEIEGVSSEKQKRGELDKPDEAVFPLPISLKSVVDAPVDPLVSDAFNGEVGKFIAPVGVVSDAAKEAADRLKNRVQPLNQSQSSALLNTLPSSGMIWLQPMDAGFATDKKKLSSNNNPPSMLADLDQNPLNSSNSSFSALDKTSSKAMKSVGLEGDVDPRFTIANGSVITNALTVTAMVGRIPVEGNITDPWRFKISTGANIVMPNGHELQGLEKTIVQGDAVGDLNLRCVSARIDTMTFIFSDGRIVTHKTKAQGNTQSARPDQFLGYVSDQWANPCIPGELITNAPQAISQMGLLGVAAGMADGIAEAETQTTVTDRGSVIKNVVGDQLTYAGYKGVATGINDVRSWFKGRMGQYFDVIYARAGQVVDIHITQEIKIDYDPTGRKVRYEKTDASASDFGYMD